MLDTPQVKMDGGTKRAPKSIHFSHLVDGTVHATDASMLDVTLSIFALIAGGVTMELFSTSKTPPTQQDERSFLPARYPCSSTEEFQSGNAS